MGTVIYKSDNGFVISSHGCWLPGIYADEKAARWAFSFEDNTLQALTDRICRAATGGRAITTGDLRAARHESPAERCDGEQP